MNELKAILKELIGHYVVLHCQPVANDCCGGDFTVEGVLERVTDSVIVLRVGKARRYLTNIVLLQVYDYGVVEA